MTTYEKHLYGVAGSTQGADAPLIRATHVLKTEVEYVYSTEHIKNPTPKKEKNIVENT